MKIIFSRKGFDSSAGGVPSPILPDGTLLPLPIPDRHSGVAYGQINLRDRNLGEVVESLTKGRIPARYNAHLDPDLEESALLRPPGWRPSLGQARSAQGVLKKNGVGPGDLFLFFGWFREAEMVGARLRFRRGAPDLHVLFGWLDVDRVIPIDAGNAPDWAKDHPHVRWPERPQNTLYVGSDGGIFERFQARLQLTVPGKNRSVWSLPEWFHPGADRPPLCGHGRDLTRWQRTSGATILRSVYRGQEFVLDADAYPEAEGWARSLITEGS